VSGKCRGGCNNVDDVWQALSVDHHMHHETEFESDAVDNWQPVHGLHNVTEVNAATRRAVLSTHWSGVSVTAGRLASRVLQ
jgi:hypothetical protein